MGKTMSKEKKEEIVEENVEEVVIEKKEIRKSRKIQKRIFTFDVYFQLLMRKNKAVSAHHKAPIKQFMVAKGVLEATEEEFDRLFKLY